MDILVILKNGDALLYNYLHDFFDFNVDNNSINPIPENENEASSQMSEATDGSITINKSGRFIHCLTIIGQIEGHYASSDDVKTTKYEHIIPRLVAVEESDDVSGLLVILNTIGGDIEAGLAIAELISGMKKPSVSLVLGGSHSIGIPLAVSTDKSFVVPTATMTVHPVRMNGLVLGVPQTLVYLNKMEDRVVEFVTRNSSVTAERFKEMMLNSKELITDFGTILNGKQAVEEGLIDRVGSLSDALDCLYEMININ